MSRPGSTPPHIVLKGFCGDEVCVYIYILVPGILGVDHSKKENNSASIHVNEASRASDC